jgi:hypothetical protein
MLYIYLGTNYYDEPYLYIARLAEAIGKKNIRELFQKYANNILSAIRRQCWDKSQMAYIDGLYSDDTKSKHASQQANAMMLALSLAEKEQEQGMMKMVKDAGQSTGVLLVRFLVQAYGEHIEDDALYEYLTNPEGRNWAYILANGGSFTWENWRLTEKRDISESDGLAEYSASHGLGAYGAVSVVQDYILGVKPLRPQYALIQIKPHLTGKLRFAKGKIPTQRGQIFVDWQNIVTDETFILKIKIPFNIVADVYIPKDQSTGTIVNVDGINKNGIEAGKFFLFKGITAGEHVFVRK